MEILSLDEDQDNTITGLILIKFLVHKELGILLLSILLLSNILVYLLFNAIQTNVNSVSIDSMYS